jgi:hypothetical protein
MSILSGVIDRELETYGNIKLYEVFDLITSEVNSFNKILIQNIKQHKYATTISSFSQCRWVKH